MRLFKSEVHSQAPHYEHYAQMDLEALPSDAVADPAIRNAILMSRQKLAERAARQAVPPPRPRFRDKLDRLIQSRRSRFGGMALVAALAIGSLANFAGNDGSSEAAFQPSQPVPTAPETTTTTLSESIHTEKPAESVVDAVAPVEDVSSLEPVQEHKIFIRAGGTLWWEVDDIFASAGLHDSACREVATRGIVTALRVQYGSDLNNVYAGQDFSVLHNQVEEHVQLAAQNPACSVNP